MKLQAFHSASSGLLVAPSEAKGETPNSATTWSGQGRQKILYWLAFVVGLAWMIGLFLRSPGAPIQDEVGHFLISKNAWHHLELILNIWGRPINTMVYMLPSLWGFEGARVCSIILACLTVIITTLVAAKLGVRQLWLIPLLMWFQPWYNDLEYSAITEVPFSFLLILAIYLWLNGRIQIAALVCGLLPLVRFEGMALVGAWCCYYFFHKQWKAIVAACAPSIIYNLVYFLVLHGWPVLIYFAPKPTTLYGSGGWLHFVRPLIHGVGPVLFVLAALAIVWVRQNRTALLFFGCYGLYFFVETLIYRFGSYASGGYGLFLLPIAPSFAIAGAISLDRIFARPHEQDRFWIKPMATVIVMLILGAVIFQGLRTSPRPLDPEGIALQQAANWVKAEKIAPARLISTHVWFYYFADLPIPPRTLWVVPPRPDEAPAGSVVVWDAHYSNQFGLDYATLVNPKNRWQRLRDFGDGFAIVLQKK